GGRIRNTRINTGEFWWAWVDLNHRPRPYQGPLRCYMHSMFFVRRGDPLWRVVTSRLSGRDSLFNLSSRRSRSTVRVCRRAMEVCLDIREVQVQCHQHTILRAATLGEHRIARTREFLVGDRIRFEACLAKDRHVFFWRVFVDLKFQALISSGKSTVPSRVNSAAYANAASISGSVSTG